MGVFPREHRCDLCGKSFLGWSQWTYRDNGKWYCSWGCLREYRGIKAAGRLSRMDRRRVENLLAQGMRPREVAKEMGITEPAVIYYGRKAQRRA